MNFLKLIYFFLGTLCLCFYAHSGEDSGGGAYHTQSLKLFQSLSAQEAWSSHRFNKKIGNIGIPGTSTFYKPTSLCISEGYIELKSGGSLSHPIHYNTEVDTWGVRDENGRVTRYRTRSEAQKHGRPILLSTQTVSHSLPTTFTADFYRSSAQDRYHRSKYLGQHRYRLSSCR